MTSLSIMKEWEVKLNSFEIGADAKTSSELFHCIEQHLDDCEKVSSPHVAAWEVLN